MGLTMLLANGCGQVGRGDPDATSLWFGCLEWVHGDGVGDVADGGSVVTTAWVAV
jgi:hypothetical protein